MEISLLTESLSLLINVCFSILAIAMKKTALTIFFICISFYELYMFINNVSSITFICDNIRVLPVSIFMSYSIDQSLMTEISK